MQVQTVKHNLHKVKPSLPQMEETKENKERIKRMMITSNFDLRGIDSKIQVMRKTPLCTGYMIFLNARGSLAHIMHHDDLEDADYRGIMPIERFPIPLSLCGAHPEYIRHWIFRKMIVRAQRLL
jgi:transcription antitermination factor NusG